MIQYHLSYMPIQLLAIQAYDLGEGLTLSGRVPELYYNFVFCIGLHFFYFGKCPEQDSNLHDRKTTRT